ncbi:ABC transporter permease [Campylobacter fetus]|nr:ABC transporter permease [Campylobacter fetus]
MSFKRIFAIVVKESLQAMRDPSTALIAIILPIILLFLMGYAVSLDAKNISFGIVNYSSSKDSKEIISKFVASKFFRTKITTDKNELINDMKLNKISGFLIIDDDKNSLKFQIIADGSEPNTANLIRQYGSSIIYIWAENLNSKRVLVESRYWFNEKLSSRYFLIPGSIAVIMTLIGTLLTSLVIAKEWERGTMESLMSTPVSNLEIIIGKLIPYFVFAMLSAVICFFVAYFWYEIPFRGSIFILFLLSFIYLFPALLIGLLISTIAKNQFVAAQISIIVGFLPAFLLSGFVFEINNMPTFIQYLSYFVPATYFVNSLGSIFLVGNLYDVFILDAICMLIIGFVVGILVLKKSKRSLD